jgi:hypothetical protein
MTKKLKDKIKKLDGKYITDDDDNVIFAEINLTDVFNNQIKAPKKSLEYTYENKLGYSDEEINKLREQEKKDREGKTNE